MKTKTLVVAASVATSTMAAAFIVVPRDCFIVAVTLCGTTTVSAATIMIWQLSTLASQQTLATNDVQGVIHQVNGRYEQITGVGIVSVGFNEAISGIAFSLKSGDRLYLHYAGSAVTTTCQAIVHITE